MYSSQYRIRMIKSRRMRWAGHVALIPEKRNAYMLLCIYMHVYCGESRRNRSLGRPRRTWLDSIKMI
jgi:hypothetical protein